MDLLLNGRNYWQFPDQEQSTLEVQRIIIMASLQRVAYHLGILNPRADPSISSLALPIRFPFFGLASSPFR